MKRLIIVYHTMTGAAQQLATAAHSAASDQVGCSAELVTAAAKRNLPIFLDLYADWCHPCKKLEKETFSHPSVRELLLKYLVVKFNVDQIEGKKLVRLFRVERFPTTLILDAKGREIERIIGEA